MEEEGKRGRKEGRGGGEGRKGRRGGTEGDLLFDPDQQDTDHDDGD